MSKEIIVERGTKTVYRDGDTIVTDTGAGMTADGGDNMSADEGK